MKFSKVKRLSSGAAMSSLAAGRGVLTRLAGAAAEAAPGRRLRQARATAPASMVFMIVFPFLPLVRARSSSFKQRIEHLEPDAVDGAEVGDGVFGNGGDRQHALPG